MIFFLFMKKDDLKKALPKHHLNKKKSYMDICYECAVLFFAPKELFISICTSLTVLEGINPLFCLRFYALSNSDLPAKFYTCLNGTPRIFLLKAEA